MMTRFRKITSALVVASVLGAGTAYAAVKYLRDFSAVVGITDNDNTFWCQVNGGCQATDPLKRVTMAQIWQYVFSKVSGDFVINSSTGVGTLASTAVTPGTYGDSTHVSQVTIDSKGRATGAANVAIAGGAGGTVTTVKDPSTTVASPAIINYTAGCVVSNNAGNADVACSGGGGGSGTVGSGALGQLAWYAGAGTTVAGNPNVSVLGGSLVSNFNAVALPAPPGGGVTVFQAGAADGNISRNLLDAFGAGNSFIGRRANGTNASKSALLLNDVIAALNAFGYGSTGYSSAYRGRFAIAASQNWTDAAQGTRVTAATTPNGGTTAVDRFSVENDGGVTVAADATGAPPTGGSKGPGTVNVAGNYYVNGVPVGGFGVDGGTAAQTLTAGATLANGTRLVKIGSGWTTGTVTLQAISAVSADTCVRIEDGGNFIDATHTLTVKGGTSDGLNGGAANGTIGPFTTAGSFVVACVSAANNWNVGPGTIAASSPSQLAVGVNINGLVYNTATSITNGALSLGSSGTAGSVAMGNATSGTLTIQPVAGALGSPTLSLPALTKTLTATIFSGAKALATGAISSAACTSAQTDTATGTLTTDVVLASFNGDPTAVTGYVPLTAGMLTIIAYPTADTVNFKVCNNTSASVTPGAITLNWRVVR